MKIKYPFDLVLSFAEEDRNVAAGIKDCLYYIGISTYYYPDHPEENWAHPLGRKLAELYEYGGRMGLVLLSKNYTWKKFTRIEFKALNQRRRKSDADFLLVLRLDDSNPQEIKELPHDLTYLDWQFNPREIAELVKKKLKAQGWKSKKKGKKKEKPVHTPNPNGLNLNGDGNIQVGGNITSGGNTRIK